MNDDTVRVGLVSSVNQDTGMVRVTYPDRDREVTPELPFFKMGNEYQMPEVNDMVLVLHLSNDSSMGIVMGGFWNDEELPVSGTDVFRKGFSRDGRSFLRLAAGTLLLESPDLAFGCVAGQISVAEILEMKRKVDAL